MNPYIENILEQPTVLRRLVKAFSKQNLAPIRSALREGRYDRIILTGMGASYSAGYPVQLALSGLGLPVMLVNSAELVHYGLDLIGPHSLVWMNSQSGRSAELVHLMDKLQSASTGCVLACVNDTDSPLAQGADICLPIHAGPEATVGTKTYLNTVAASMLAAAVLTKNNPDEVRDQLLKTAEGIEVYLKGIEDHKAELDDLLGEFNNLILLGRGPSMGAVWTGALITKESTKFQLEGMNAAEFRHGPLELVEPGFTALLFAGAPTTRELNRKLALDIKKFGGRVLWIDDAEDAEIDTVMMPSGTGWARSLVEMLPVEILTLVLADRQGVTAGAFRHVTKVTVEE